MTYRVFLTRPWGGRVTVKRLGAYADQAAAVAAARQFARAHPTLRGARIYVRRAGRPITRELAGAAVDPNPAPKRRRAA